jgi:hypothetical protein
LDALTLLALDLGEAFHFDRGLAGLHPHVIDDVLSLLGQSQWAGDTSRRILELIREGQSAVVFSVRKAGRCLLKVVRVLGLLRIGPAIIVLRVEVVVAVSDLKNHRLILVVSPKSLGGIHGAVPHSRPMRKVFRNKLLELMAVESNHLVVRY